MKLAADAVIARAKAANYLLKWQPENDKSQFLALAGYRYRISGTLTGLNGRALPSRVSKFITLYPAKED